MKNLMLMAILALIVVIPLNPVFAEQILKGVIVQDKGILIGENERWVLFPGSVLEITESRYEASTSQVLIKGSLQIRGQKDKPAIITFSERPFDSRKSKIIPIDIDEETLVYLPPDTRIVEYELKTYQEKGFEEEINDFIYDGAKFYPLLNILAGIAYSRR